MPLSHLECRKLVCGVCLRKEKHTQAINPAVLALIKMHHYRDYSLQDEYLPLIACKSCVATLKAIDKVRQIQFRILNVYILFSQGSGELQENSPYS